MRSSAVLTIALFIFSTHLGFAKELANSNLDYSLKSEKGIAKLIITNEKTDTPVQLKSVTIFLSSAENKEEKESKPIEIPIAQNQVITKNTTIELGSDSDLAQQLLQITYPNLKMSQIKSVHVSDDYNCQPHNQLCKSIGFAIKIDTAHDNGNVQESITTVAVMNYII